jgi:hypothetical protein
MSGVSTILVEEVDFNDDSWLDLGITDGGRLMTFRRCTSSKVKGKLTWRLDAVEAGWDPSGRLFFLG